MILRIATLALLSASLGGCATIQNPRPLCPLVSNGTHDMVPRESRLEEAIVIYHSARPPLSGFLRTWVEFHVRQRNGAVMSMYMPYLSDGQFVPEANLDCRFTFHREFANGVTSAHAVPRDHEISLIDSVSCGDPPLGL